MTLLHTYIHAYKNRYINTCINACMHIYIHKEFTLHAIGLSENVSFVIFSYQQGFLKFVKYFGLSANASKNLQVSEKLMYENILP
jgi:hypothetical protein